MPTDIKPWRCKNDHIMGITVRDGSKVRELILYRHAIDPQKPGRQVEVMGRLSGYMADIRCSICGAMRTWVPGEEAMKTLQSHYRAQHPRQGLGRRCAPTEEKNDPTD